MGPEQVTAEKPHPDTPRLRRPLFNSDLMWLQGATAAGHGSLWTERLLGFWTIDWRRGRSPRKTPPDSLTTKQVAL